MEALSFVRMFRDGQRVKADKNQESPKHISFCLLFLFAKKK